MTAAAYELGLSITPQRGRLHHRRRGSTRARPTPEPTPARSGAPRAAAGDGTFSSGTASGWQKCASARPVAVTAGQNYVVSYTSSERPLRQQGLPVGQLWPDRSAPDRGRRLREPAGRGVRRSGFVSDEQLQQRQLLRRRPVRHRGHLRADGVRALAAGRLIERPAGPQQWGRCSPRPSRRRACS